MNRKIPFLVGAGHLSENQMRTASRALSECWGGDLITFLTAESPSKCLQNISIRNGLVSLIGDAAIPKSHGDSWFEELGAWRQPTILLAFPLASEEIPGSVPAYAALCSTLSVPLLGVVQIGGSWSPTLRRRDGLPWCGWMPDPLKPFEKDKDCETLTAKEEIEEVICTLRIRMIDLVDNINS